MRKAYRFRSKPTHIWCKVWNALMHSCGGNFLTYTYPHRNIMSGCAGGSKEGHKNLCKWAKISKLGEKSYIMLPRINIWHVSLIKSMGKLDVIWLHCAKLGHFKLIHRKHLTAANLTDLCNCFSLGKAEMPSLVAEDVRQTLENIHQWQFL